MTDSKPKQLPPYGIRIPIELKSRVQAEAAENGRSLHGEIIHTLEEKYPEPTVSGEALARLISEVLNSAPEGRNDAIYEINGEFETRGLDMFAHLEENEIVLSMQLPKHLDDDRRTELTELQLETIAQNLATIRKESGISFQDLAKKALIPAAHIVSLEEKAIANPRLSMLLAIASGLGVTIEKLLARAPDTNDESG